MQTRTDRDAKTKVFELIKDIRTTLMVTHDGTQLSARPMVAAGLEKFEGELWFFTGLDTPKVEEIATNPDVLLAYSEPKDQHYVSIRGTAELVKDRAKIDEYWTDYNLAWFPKGKDDPNVVLIRVAVASAEYWDVPSGMMVHLFGLVKTKLTGEHTKNVGDTGRVDFKHSA